MILEFIDSTLAESYSDESRKEDCESAFGIMLELIPTEMAPVYKL